jgi:hypothetical protein
MIGSIHDVNGCSLPVLGRALVLPVLDVIGLTRADTSEPIEHSLQAELIDHCLKGIFSLAIKMRYDASSH